MSFFVSPHNAKRQKKAVRQRDASAPPRRSKLVYSKLDAARAAGVVLVTDCLGDSRRELRGHLAIHCQRVGLAVGVLLVAQLVGLGRRRSGGRRRCGCRG